MATIDPQTYADTITTMHRNIDTSFRSLLRLWCRTCLSAHRTWRSVDMAYDSRPVIQLSDAVKRRLEQQRTKSGLAEPEDNNQGQDHAQWRPAWDEESV
jgi:hypothetical protein